MPQTSTNMSELIGLATGRQPSGDMDRAGAACGQIPQPDPRAAEAMHQRGVVAYQSGDHENALLFFQRATELDPANPHYQNNLGVVYQDVGKPAQAIACYRLALDLRGDLASAHSNLGGLLVERHEYVEAEQHCREAIRLRPGLAEAYSNLGLVFSIRAKLCEARECYQQAIALQPSLVDAHRNLGNVLLEQGHLEEARREYEEVIRLNPREVRALGSLSLIKRHTLSDHADLDRVERRLEDPLLTPGEQAELNFAMGKICDDCELYDKAFRHYRRANTLVRPAFDRSLFETMLNQWMSAFTRERFAAATPGGSPSETPVFVLGMPRSGTTLVEQILASHPQVHGAGELTDLTEISDRLASDRQLSPPYPLCLFNMPQSRLAELAEWYLARRREEAPEALRVTDKMPANFLMVGLIARLFPNARVIHCVRDPRDVCLSCYFADFITRPVYAYDLEDLGFFHRMHDRLMDHWRAVVPIRMMQVRYEELIVRPEEISRKLVDFCGLDWDDRCLRFFENARPVRTSSGWQVRQPIYTTSVGRWRDYAKHLGPLFKALGLPPE